MYILFYSDKSDMQHPTVPKKQQKNKYKNRLPSIYSMSDNRFKIPKYVLPNVKMSASSLKPSEFSETFNVIIMSSPHR